MKTLTVAAVQLWSSRSRTPADNRRHALDMLARAAAGGPDLVVLPEAVSMLCYPDGRPGFTYRDVAEPVPGPTTEAAAALARRHGVNVVLGLVADHGPDRPCQNVVVVINRRGELVGRYAKTHEPELCRAAQAAGVGETLPVFRLGDVCIGVFVCWDLLAPEVAALLTLQGAELLCFPHLMAFPAPRNLALALRARAADNAVPIVAAGMRDAHNHNGSQDGLYPTCLLDADGAVVAQSTAAGADVVMATIGLDPPRVDHMGRAGRGLDWRAQRRREVRPALYARAYAALAATPPFDAYPHAPPDDHEPT